MMNHFETVNNLKADCENKNHRNANHKNTSSSHANFNLSKANEAYPQSLRKLSDDELEFRLKDLIQKERKLLYVILEHIKEVSRRELYLAKAYSSMYEYLTKEMGYSGSSAMRRLEAANLLRDLPSLAENIKDGSVNLSQACELSRAIKDKERISRKLLPVEMKEALLMKITSKTTAETQKILAESLGLPLQIQDKKRVQQDESVRLEMTLTKEQFEKLQRSRDELVHVLSQNHKDISWGNVIEVLCEKHLQKVLPRTIAASVTEGVAELSNAVGTLADRRKSQSKVVSLFEDRCCQFVDRKTGRKCQSTFALQVDHLIPRWAGGRDESANLQYLCAAHNAYKYRRQAGISRR